MPKDILYAVPVKGVRKVDGETLPYKSALLGEDEEIALMPSPELDTIKKLFENSVNENGTSPFLGTRLVEESKDEEVKFGKYEFKTYDDIYLMSECLAKSIAHRKLYCEQTDQSEKMKLIGIYAKN